MGGNVQALLLNDFRCQTKWSTGKCSFDQLTSIINRMPNVKHLSWILMSDMQKENLLQMDLVNLNQWKGFLSKMTSLLDFDFLVKCPSKSLSDFPHDFIRILAKISSTSDRTIQIEMDNAIKDEVRSILLFSRTFIQFSASI